MSASPRPMREFWIAFGSFIEAASRPAFVVASKDWLSRHIVNCAHLPGISHSMTPVINGNQWFT
jgi:hypothetical protein